MTKIICNPNFLFVFVLELYICILFHSCFLFQSYFEGPFVSCMHPVTLVVSASL